MEPIDLILKVSLAIGAVGPGIYWLIKSYYLLKNKSQYQKLEKRVLRQILISYIISVFCIACLATLLTQYLYPDYAVFAPYNYFPIFRKTPLWVNFGMITIIIISGIYFTKKLFKS